MNERATYYADGLVYRPALGLICLDRSRRHCRWATKWCKAKCYCGKFETMQPDYQADYDTRLDLLWDRWTGATLRAALRTKRQYRTLPTTPGTLPTHRLRVCSKGEPFAYGSDIRRLAEIVAFNSDILFWIPTRAWSIGHMQRLITKKIGRLPNSRLCASVDPDTHTLRPMLQLARYRDWHTLIVTEDKTPCPNAYPCPKTWGHIKGSCADCIAGCFRKDKQTISLQKH